MFSKNDDKKINELTSAILLLKNAKEAKMFLRDLLTESELIEFGNRWMAARMLDEKIPYTEIIKKTGLSSTTVARVSDWLNGGMGGYKLMLKGFKNKHHSSSFARRGWL